MTRTRSTPPPAEPTRARPHTAEAATSLLAGAGAGLLASSLLWALAPTAPLALAAGVFTVTALGSAVAAGAARRWWQGGC